ncbi:MAG: flavodoxin-dependent (E)-4-hydroxy-3-methylbut-2-enyl-diphosphate synthase [Deltaproteobacteria bacterium]|nr:flavodoxin-dependent (E)-4-hydroxy-3-methylbut-2-enyl-diphosphate synthase [Deltaproteobacteria bacterium]
MRRQTRQVHVGPVPVGGDAPISVQSMTKTDTRDVDATSAQIDRLAAAGCEIIRSAVIDEDAAKALAAIIKRSPIPVIADIHFDHRLALIAIESGVAGLRINPGNIGTRQKIKKVADAARDRGIPIRIGVNAGSLEKDLLATYGGPVPEAMTASALRHVVILEKENFYDIKISLKSSDVLTTVAAYRLMTQETAYPLHVGVTEAGGLLAGAIKSALGIGTLLGEGIGDTIRVSLTRDPVEEVMAGYEILRALDIRHRGVEIISCPTCGRCEIDLFGLVEEVSKGLAHITAPLRIAVMGCVVNGPGEAKSAALGVAGGRGQGTLFKAGKVIKKFDEKDLLQVLVEQVEREVQ